MIELFHITAFGGNSDCAVPTFQYKIDFKLPEPRKERIITTRDKLGRIITSRPSGMAVFT